MFDIGATELLVIAIVAILVIGPKDMPLALRTAGRWIGKVRRVSGHFKAGVESMIREAELEEMDKKWREQNEAIMAAHPNEQMQPLDRALDDDTKAGDIDVVSRAEPEVSPPQKASDPAVLPPASQSKTSAEPAKPSADGSAEPGLPFGKSERPG